MVINTKLHAWNNIGASSQVKDWVTQGVPIIFSSIPQSYNFHNPVFNKKQEQFLDDKIDTLLHSGAIGVSPSRPYCVSPLKLVPKKKDSFRLITDLSCLNQNIHVPKFSLEGIDTVLKLVEHEDHMTTIDLKDGFFQVRVNKQFCTYLGFQWRGVYYHWRVLPQGLSCSPYYFAKILRPVVQYLRSLGVKLVIYVDDIIIIASLKWITDHSDLVVHTLEDLGWIINYSKCFLAPSQKRKFLGHIVCSVSPAGHPFVKVSRERIKKLKRSIKMVFGSGRVSKRQLARIAGQAVSMTKAIVPAKLLLQNTYRMISSLQAWDDKVQLTGAVTRDLEWWLSAVDNWNGRTISQTTVQIQCLTDASTTGWGSYISEDQKASGLWEPCISAKSSNFRELMTVGMTLLSFHDTLCGKVVQILSDNVTTVACINNLYTPSQELGQLMTDIWIMAHKLGVTLVAKHLAGRLNVLADHLSRVNSPYEWALDRKMFLYLDILFGPHTVDRFASMRTAQLPIYNSLYHDPMTSGVDALSQSNWRDNMNFVNAPFFLIPRVLQVVREQRAEATIIAPKWPAQVWFRDLVRMSVSAPIRLKNNGQTFVRLLSLPEPRKNKHWEILAWRVSGKID